MNRLVILNANNQSMEVSVVRYFGDGSNNYFIFSLNEIDIQGRMNIYVTKVINQGGTIVGTNIIVPDNVKKAFYTALGRERMGSYKFTTNTWED